jgi:hypothetical protein
MTKPIPIKMRQELQDDPFMTKCCVRNKDCMDRIEWHHNLIYAGKRVNEKGSILPLCQYHHRTESGIKKILNKIMYGRMSDDDRSKYPKRDIW